MTMIIEPISNVNETTPVNWQSNR